MLRVFTAPPAIIELTSVVLQTITVICMYITSNHIIEPCYFEYDNENLTTGDGDPYGKYLRTYLFIPKSRNH